MKVAVSSVGNTLSSFVDIRFGRCPYFIIVEIENNKIKGFEFVPNEAAMVGGGAGIRAAQLVATKGANAVICGNIGPNAMLALSQAGIKVYIASGMSVKDAVEKFIKGELTEVSAPTFRPGGFRRRFRGGW